VEFRRPCVGVGGPAGIAIRLNVSYSIGETPLVAALRHGYDAAFRGARFGEVLRGSGASSRGGSMRRAYRNTLCWPRIDDWVRVHARPALASAGWALRWLCGSLALVPGPVRDGLVAVLGPLHRPASTLNTCFSQPMVLYRGRRR